MTGIKTRALAWALLFASSSLAGCATTRTPPATPDGQATLEQATRGSNAFALDLYREVAVEGDNLFFSPASISLAMGFAYRGADGETAGQLREAMHFPGGPTAYLPAAGALDRMMDLSGEGRELRSANAFWVSDELDLVPAFDKYLDIPCRKALSLILCHCDYSTPSP